MIELSIVRITEELEYKTLHLVPVDKEHVSGELFYNVALDQEYHPGEIINIQHEKIAELQQAIAELSMLIALGGM